MPNMFTGTSAADTFWGTEQDDIFIGNGGEDYLFGNGGNDVFHGNTASPVVVHAYGGTGNDTYILTDFMEIVERPGEGTDTIIAGRSIDLNIAGLENIENITLVLLAISSVGNDRNNVMRGQYNVGSTFTAGLGNDQLFGGLAIDTLRGEAGNDLLIGGAGGDTLDGGSEIDTVSYVTARAAVRANLTSSASNLGDAAGDIYTAIENLTGSAFGDTLIGSALNNVISGGNGNDILSGGVGNDTLIGGLGLDTLFGGATNDRFVYASALESRGATVDIIRDFDDGSNDTIDLSAIYAGKLIWRGGAALTGGHQVHIRDIAGPDVLVEVNLSGTVAPEMVIRLAGTTLGSMTATDFVL